MCKIVKCYQCGDKILDRDKPKEIDEGVICSGECYDKYLALGASLNELIEIHREQL